jgi:hypothetical protein
MKSFMIFIAGAIVGGIATVILGAGLFTGIGAGAGIATALPAGACLAVDAASQQGLITEAQAADVLSATGKQLSAHDATSAVLSSGLTPAECEKVIAQLKASAKQGD